MDSDLYSIVVIGAMNPRIHHPAWYRAEGLIATEEEQAAYESKNTLTTPPIANIDLGVIQIICQEGRWDVKTLSGEHIERIREITGRVFDELLPHTPVRAYGFNFDFRRTTSCKNVAIVLAQQIGHAKLGFDMESAIAAEVTMRRRAEGDDEPVIRVTVSPADGKAVSVANNCHYDLSGNVGKFDLRPKINATFDRDLNRARRQVHQIVDQLNQLGTT